MNTKLNLIWAQTLDGVIGVNGELPFRLPNDLKRFKELTNGHAVLMGRKTWQSLPAGSRPLPKRDNYVLSRYKDYKATGATVINDANEVFQLLHTLGDKELFVIGGSSLYEMFLPYAQNVYVTFIKKSIPVNEEDIFTYAPFPQLVGMMKDNELRMANRHRYKTEIGGYQYDTPKGDIVIDNGIETEFVHYVRMKPVEVQLTPYKPLP